MKQKLSVPDLVGSMHAPSTVNADYSFKAWFAHTDDSILTFLPKVFEIKTVYDAREVLKIAGLFALDLVMADTEGNISY